MAQTDIDELLNSIRAENEVNGEKFAKAFDEITAKLDNMASGNETEELVRESLLSLRVELESRHRYVIEKLETVKDSFEVLNEKQDLLTKNSDLKIMFNILNENIDHFVQDVSEQKSMLDILENKLDEFRNDTSKKDEIIEKVLIVKEDVDDVKRGLEASIMEVNSSLRNITKTIMTMDVTDQNDIIKRELENIYLATNAILSSIEISDQKNDDLAKSVVTKEDLINFSGKMDNSFALVSENIKSIGGSEQIISEIEKNRDELKAFNENISSELSGYLSSFKAVLSDCLEDISKNQPVTSSESDLTVIKRFEILENLSREIKAVEAALNSQGESSAVLINTSFNDLQNVIENFKNSVNSNHIELESEFTTKINALETALQEIPVIVNEKFDKWQELIAKIIESVHDAASFSDFKVNESLNSISELKSKLDMIASDIAEVQSSESSRISEFDEKISTDFSGFKTKLCEIDENLNNFKCSFVNSAIENKDFLAGLMNETSEKIRVILSGLQNDDVNKEFENLKVYISDLSAKFEDLRVVFTSLSAGNVEKILTEIRTHSTENCETLQKVADVMEHNFSGINQNIDKSLIENKQNFSELSSKLDIIAASSVNGELVSKLEEIEASTLEHNQHFHGLNSKLDTIAALSSGKEDIITKLENLEVSAFENRRNLDGLKSKIDDFSTNGSDKIVSKLENLESKIDMANVDIATDLDTNSDMMKEFIDEYRHDSIKSSEEILTLSDNIKNLENELVENSNKFNSAIGSQLSDLNNCVLALKDLCENDDNGASLLEQAEKLQAVEKSLNVIGEKFNENFECLQNKVADYSKAVADIALETKGKLGLSLEEIHSVKSELSGVLEKVSENGSDFTSRLTEIADVIIARFDEISENFEKIQNNSDTDLDTVIRNNLLNIEDKFVELQGLLNENSEKIDESFENSNSNLLGKIDDLRQEIGLINTDLSDIISTKTDALVESFVPLKETIDTFVENEFDKLVGNIKSQVELACLNFSADVNESLAENHDNYVHLEDAYKVLVDKFSDIHNIISDLNENQIGLVVATIKEIDKTQSDNFENTNSLIASWKTELSNLQEKLDIRLSGLEGALKRGFLEQKAGAELNKKEIKSAIEPLLKKNEFDEGLSENSARLNELISTESEDVKSGIKTSAEEIKSEILRVSEKSETAVNALKSSVENLDNKSDSFAKADQAQQIEELVNSLSEKIDVLAMSSDAEVLQEMVNELHEKVDILAMSSDAEVLQEMVNELHAKVDAIAMSSDAEVIQDMMTELHAKVDTIAMSSDAEIVQDMLAAITEKVNTLAMSEEAANIENLVQTLHDKVDVLASTDDADLYNEIQDIKDLINEQRKQIEDFGSEGSDFDRRLQSLLAEISNIDFEKSASDIKDSVMNAVLAVTDQITFTEETEEIKGFVEERTDEINKNLLDVKKQLCSIASGSDVWDYSYTMQDIESDIAKLRLILNDISASTSKEDLNEISKNMHKLAASVNTLHTTLTEEQINELKDNVLKINEDVVSLSSRTNKLLLNSDESHKALTDGLEELNRVLSLYGNAPASEVIEKKLDNINAAIATSANMDNVMREVMLYLGEWIDDASEKMNTIASDTSNLSSITSELCYLKSMIGNSDIIEAIRKKFEVQQARIDTLESKLDRILDLFDTHNPEVIENKIESFESKTDLFIQKMESFDKKFDSFDKKLKGLDDKLGKLSEGIEKLAAYVD